ncbi:YwqG family protein [Prevotella sp. KH2C16]|uniref:YwqG family protein n=1 Tax=Prevotella sp. KH2C16 TaxID=1855325 RepID=UPI0008EF0DFD|nr:DUF1963 domain-containing protein [Prevotella sp. KH2C16]SFG68370.1 Uncharacterized protein YwqG [Prevotella sp. KH2C16]
MKTISFGKSALKGKTARAKAIADEIKRRTKTACWQMTIDEARKPGLTDSKLGGLPYWPVARDYPTGAEGQKMFLLVQVNFAQFKAAAPLPDHGLLQIFLSPKSEYYGADLDHPAEQKNFRVVYHEDIDPAVTASQVEALGLPVNTQPDLVEYTPCCKELALSIKPAEMHTTLDDGRFPGLFCEVVKDLFGKTLNPENKDYTDLIDELFDEDEAYHNYFFDAFYHEENQLLGYPSFTQTDPRTDFAKYDTLLLQLVSDDEDNILWGDAGDGNFFINREALLRRDFSDVLYNWDCY